MDEMNWFQMNYQKQIYLSSVFYLTYETVDTFSLLLPPTPKVTDVTEKKTLDRQQLYYTEPQQTKYFIEELFIIANTDTKEYVTHYCNLDICLILELEIHCCA